MNLFGTKSLETILSSFNQTKSDLEIFMDVQTAEADKLHADATTKLAEAESKRMEVQKANRVRDNITKLMEG